MAKAQKQAFKKTTATASVAPAATKRQLINWPMLFLACAIAAITFISFSPALKNGFINWDDNAYVFENNSLAKPLPEAVTYFFGQHYFIGNYVPLTMITYALEYHAAGLKPALFHKVNLLLHLANVLLMFWFIFLLSKKKPAVAAFVTLFFGIHPMHVESVAWIAELKDVLFSFFFIGGLIAYYKYLERRTNAQAKPLLPLGLALLLFIFSLLSKPAAVTFPVVLMLLDFYTRRKLDARAWLEKLPFFILSIIFGVINILSQQADRMIHDYYSFTDRLFFACHSFLVYIGKLFVPVQQAIFYPYPVVKNGVLPIQYYLAPIGVALLLFGVYRSLKQSRLVPFGFLFFAVNIILVLQLVSVGEAIMADRYTYLSYTGLLFVMGMGLDKLYQNGNPTVRRYRLAGMAAIVALAGACAYLTHERCKVWRNDETIATDLLNKFPEDWLALNNKGFIEYEEHNFSEARKLFHHAVELRKDYTMAYINLMNAYMSEDLYPEAMQVADTALKYVPKDHNLLDKKGYLLFLQQKYTEALRYYKTATRYKHNDVNAYINMTETYYALKDYKAAMAMADSALTFEPHNAILLNNKGYMLYTMGQYRRAIPYFEKALQLKPDYRTASINLEDSYRKVNDSTEAKKAKRP